MRRVKMREHLLVLSMSVRVLDANALVPHATTVTIVKIPKNVRKVQTRKIVKTKEYRPAREQIVDVNVKKKLLLVCIVKLTFCTIAMSVIP